MGSKRFDDYCRDLELEHLESEKSDWDFMEAVGFKRCDKCGTFCHTEEISEQGCIVCRKD